MKRRAISAMPLRTYNEAIRLDPKVAEAYNNRGCAYGEEGRSRQGHRRLR